MGLSRRASQLPLTAISLGLQAWERSRGIREFGLRRANEALQIAAHTPLGRLLPQQVLDDGADEEAAVIAAAARRDTAPAAQRPAAPTAAPKPKPAAKGATERAKPAEPPAAAKAVGAPGAVTREVEQIAEQLHVDAPHDRADLPIPDFDNISLGSLRARLRALSVEQLVVLRDWEQAHANRLPVITTLDNRIAKLGTTSTASTSTASTSTGGTSAPTTVSGTTGNGGGNIAYPPEAARAERAAEGEGGTLRI